MKNTQRYTTKYTRPNSNMFCVVYGLATSLQAFVMRELKAANQWCVRVPMAWSVCVCVCRLYCSCVCVFYYACTMCANMHCTL